jgi:hypothetical protein
VLRVPRGVLGLRRASTDGLPLTVPSRVPPCESKRSSLRVSTQSTPTSGTHYRERVSRATEQECAGSITMPERPVRALQLCTPPTARKYSRLRCAAVQRARRRPLTAPARPPTPLRVRRQRMRVLRVLRRPTVPRGISIGISCDVGTRPGLGMRWLSGGDLPCRVRLRFSAARASCGTKGSHASTHSTASTPSTQRAYDAPRR